jgi:D-sedoheptulose 7-phosphate isomerase
MTFVDSFLAETKMIIDSINRDDIEAVVETLVQTRDSGGRLFLAGSGGGAGHASHATCDFRKLCGFEAYCITDNVSELTARINDDGWDSSLAMWLKSSRISKNDALLIFSVGGGSEQPAVSVNLVQAVMTASEVGARILGIVGRNGGYVRQNCTASVLIPQGDLNRITPQVEGLQAVIWHLLVSHPKLLKSMTKWESVTQR